MEARVAIDDADARDVTAADVDATHDAGAAIASPRPVAIDLVPHQVPVWNALIAATGRPLALAGLAVTIERAAPPPAPTHTLRALDVDGGVLAAALIDFPFGETHGTALDATSLADLPPALAETLTEGAVAALTERLPSGIGERIAITPGAPALAEGAVGATLTVEGAFAAPARIALAGSPRSLVALSGLTDAMSLAAEPTLAGSLVLPVRLRLDRVVMGAGEIASLEPGDAVLLDASARAPALTLLAAGRAHAVSGDAGGYMIGRVGMDDETMAADAGMNSEDADLPDLADLPVRLDIEIGSTTATVREIGGWVPGALVALDLPAPGEGVPVTLRSGGRAIGRGDLVRIDDRLAVRIASMSLKRSVDASPPADGGTSNDTPRTDGDD